ncbi:MAG: hypothetical protein MJ198_03205 [Bacteroidales bacterium]|nr:hypothetical protein [Bacteroidales bacterium]
MANQKHGIYIIIMEYAWLIISLSSLMTACVELYYHGANLECVKFGVLFVLAFAMFLYRRCQRIKEKNIND